MCNSCAKPHPDFAECHRLFYRHNGVLYRQALPRSSFGTQSSFVLYNKTANTPVRIYSSQRCIQVIGFGQISSGAINTIMDGGTVVDWYHREREKRNNSGQFVSDNDDSWMDKPIPPRYPKYAKIPTKIYKNGFLELRMEMQK